MNENDLSRVIVDAAIKVHKTLGGPGLLESIYRDAMVIELGRRGFAYEKRNCPRCKRIGGRRESHKAPVKL